MSTLCTICRTKHRSIGRYERSCTIHRTTYPSSNASVAILYDVSYKQRNIGHSKHILYDVSHKISSYDRFLKTRVASLILPCQLRFNFSGVYFPDRKPQIIETVKM